MKKKTANVMKGLGVAMAVGSVVAATSATMGQGSTKTKKKMQNAVEKVEGFVDSVSQLM